MNSLFLFIKTVLPWLILAILLLIYFSFDLKSNNYGLIGLCLGLCLGIVFKRIFNSLGIGMAIGMLTGWILGSLVEKKG
ncbi:MAG: hypothetical protein Q4B60_07040 [Erysipelotrichaceae bacterium]|nr:hypothetical protein [Erysipelotrichaceae bacterium]